MEQHHTIMNKLGDLGGQTYRNKEGSNSRGSGGTNVAHHIKYGDVHSGMPVVIIDGGNSKGGSRDDY